MAEYTIDKIEYGSNVYKLQDNVSSPKIFIAEYNTTTFSELLSAYNDGKIIFFDLVYHDAHFTVPLTGISKEGDPLQIIAFISIIPSSSDSILVVVCHLENPGESDDYLWGINEDYTEVYENTKSNKYYLLLNYDSESNLLPKKDSNDKYDTDATNAGLWYQDAILYTPALVVGDVNYTITTDEYDSIDSMLESLGV